MKKILSVVLLVVLLPMLAMAQEQPLAFKGGKILPITSEPIENGVLVVHNGIIQAVGPTSEIEIPSNAKVHDVSGKIIMPGLVDSHSHIADAAGGDRSAAIQPAVRVLDSIDPNDPSIMKALAGGITTVNIMPGSGLLMSGQTVYVKLRKANTVEEMLFEDNIYKDIYGGLKMANGTNPMGKPPLPGTRSKAAAMVRQMWVDAKEYKQKVEAADGPSEMPPRDLGKETLIEVLEGKRIVHHHTHRFDDVLTVLRIAEEFGYLENLVLHHVSEAWKIEEKIAAAGVPASIIILDSPGGKPEAAEIKYSNGAILADEGVLVGFHTDAPITNPRLLLRMAAFGVRGGMSRHQALAAVTINNAKILGLEKQVGSLEVGKDADFIVLSGDPLSVYTHVLQTWVEGVKRFDYSEDKEYATGGYGVYGGPFNAHGHFK